MNQPSPQRTIIIGSSLATALVLAILVLTGGRKPAPAPIPAPAGEAALPMLEGVNHASSADRAAPALQTTKTPDETPAKAAKPASEAPLNH